MGIDGCTYQTSDATNGHRGWSPDLAGDEPGQQAAEGHHAHEGHRIETHHPPSLVIVYDGLYNSVARCHLNHLAETGDQCKYQRKPEDTRE